MTVCSPGISVSPVSVCLQLHVLIRIQTIAAWEPSKKQCYFGNRGAVDIKIFHPESVKSSAELSVADN